MYFMQSKTSHRAAVDQQAAQCLGWTSIAIGLTEILAPKHLEKTMGVVASLADFMAVDVHLADPVGTDPQSADDRPDFAGARLHSAG